MKGLLIRADGIAEAVDFPVEDKLNWYYEKLGCDYIDIVHPYGIDEIAETYNLKSLLGKFCIICDDEALLKAEPKVNVIASLLYGVDDHGQPLCGDVLIAKDEETEDGIECVGLDDAEMMLLQVCINSLIEKHNEKVREANE